MDPINPYSEMIKMMQTHGAKNNPSSIQLATVVTKTPLSLLVGELPLNKNNLLITDYLVNNLNTGDTLAVIQLNSKTFIILAKVVSV